MTPSWRVGWATSFWVHLLLQHALTTSALQREAPLVRDGYCAPGPTTTVTAAACKPTDLLMACCCCQGSWLGSSWQSTVIIDAGSTGSRIHIYQYKVSRAGLAVVQQPISSLKVTPGLSEYVGQPDNVGQSLGPLLEYAYKQVHFTHATSNCKQAKQQNLPCCSIDIRG